jgi:hypothetical protein
MVIPTAVLGYLLLVAPTPSPAATTSQPSPSPTPPPNGPVILFLVDNSASLPPLDPDEKRVTALEKMFGFLKGQPYRLILFGAKREIAVDDVTRYRNNGQWTDFYFAFAKARDVAREYPSGVEFRIVLMTDGILDPDPAEWKDMGVPPGEDLKAHVVKQLLDLVKETKIPLYVILVGAPPADGVAPGDREQSPGLILDMVRAANGRQAEPMAQTLASFFNDDGVLLKKFVFRVDPHEGLKSIEPVVKRIVAPARSSIELRFFTFLILPLLLILVGLLGGLVRSFPGPGDLEIVELSLGSPVHVGVDRLHKVQAGGWGASGLSLVGDPREASATLTYQAPSLDLTGVGVDSSRMDPTTERLLPLSVDELKKALERLSDEGTKDEKIYALNLDYVAKNLDPEEAERTLVMTVPERRRTLAADFLRAKAHLVTNDALRRKLTEPRVQLVSYGKEADRKELVPGVLARIGRYRFIVKDLAKGGRRDVRLVLYYDRVPSLLGLKTLLPDVFQRAFRFRRSSQRVVT